MWHVLLFKNLWFLKFISLSERENLKLLEENVSANLNCGILFLILTIFNIYFSNSISLLESLKLSLKSILYVLLFIL